MRTVQCPHCKKTVAWSKESVYRPFCSERCRIIDLGAWADGSYSIPVTETKSEANGDLDSNLDHSAMNEDFYDDDSNLNENYSEPDEPQDPNES